MAAMRRTYRATIVVAALLTGTLAGTATVAASGPPEPVTIASTMYLEGTGTFEATGDAVVSGLICPTGTVEDWAASYNGSQSERVLQNMVLKQFVCAGGSGTFMVRLQNHQDLVTQTNWFSWEVLSGTDAYRGLRGRGSGTTSPEDFDIGPWNDLYTGYVVD